MKLNSSQKQKFNDDGYIILDIFSDAELENFKLSVNKIVDFQINDSIKNKKKFDLKKSKNLLKNISSLEKLGNEYVSDLGDFLTGLPESMQLIGNKKIKDIVNELLNCEGNDPIYVTNATPIIALPNDEDYTYKFHKDTFYTIPYSKFIQIWAPLIENATVKNGALQICSKSHKNNWQGQFIKQNVPNRHRFQVTKDETSKYKIIDCTLKLGQVLFFNPGIAHQSGKNRSKKARVSLVGVYHKIKNNKIRPMSPQFKYKGKTPEDYFRELNKN